MQGPPLPPHLERPERVQDLAVIQKGRSFTLRFTLPEVATDGERLSKPLEIEIFRTISPPGAASPAETSTDAPWVSFQAEDVRRSTIGKQFVYTVSLTAPEFSNVEGATFAFAVRGVTRGFRNRPVESELSNVVRARLLDVSGSVENLRVRVAEKALELEWSAPAQTLAGKPLANLSGYRVYRSATGVAGSFALRAETKSPAYGDSDFAFDHTYFYKVQAVFEGDHSVVESEDSAAIEIAPRDTFPPAAPRNVTAIYAASAVEVVWSASTEPDLAGYNVLRRRDDAKEEQVNRELLHTPIFRDPSVEAGHRYFYRVTAVDLAGNQSAASEEVEVETR